MYDVRIAKRPAKFSPAFLHPSCAVTNDGRRSDDPQAARGSTPALSCSDAGAPQTNAENAGTGSSRLPREMIIPIGSSLTLLSSRASRLSVIAMATPYYRRKPPERSGAARSYITLRATRKRCGKCLCSKEIHKRKAGGISAGRLRTTHNHASYVSNSYATFFHARNVSFPYTPLSVEMRQPS